MGIFNRLKNVIKANKNGNYNPKERNLFNMQVGDIVSIEEVDYEVEALIKYNDHGWKWTEYKLKDSRKTYWLSVEQDDDLEISLFEKIVSTISTPPKTYEYKGIKYYMQEGSEAIIEDIQGNLNLVKGEQVDYFEYSDEDGENLLSIEIWNGDIEMSIGRWVENYNVEIFPGS
ncbi:MAG: DUF4178 domain-containing protein [Firmicutes bacterium]|nr:DUF4178 domain-containing protein [Bacillota bacterium]